MSDTTNNVTGTQNIVWGDQYNAARDLYVGNTIIFGNEAPLSEEQRRQAFTTYVGLVRDENADVKLIGAAGMSLPLEDVYVNLKAARRYDDAEQEQRVRAAIHEYEEKLNKDEKLTVMERAYLIDECRFWFRSGLAPQNEELALDKAVITYPRLVILGEPGSGKTTLLRYLARQFAKVDEQNTQVPGFGYRRLPVLVRLPELMQHGFDPFAAAFTTSVYIGQRDTLIKIMREYAERGLVLFLFDGLDEVDSAQRGKVKDWLDRFAASIAPASNPQAAPLDQQAQGNRMIVTCRINSYYGNALDHANAHHVIQPLKTADRRTFLATWYTAYEQHYERQASKEAAAAWAEALAHKLDEPRYERLAEVPLLLSFLAYIKVNKGELPSNRVTLYADMVEGMMKQREVSASDDTLDELSLCLGRMAYCLNANSDAGTISETRAARFFPEQIPASWPAHNREELWQWLVHTAGVLAIRGSQVRATKRGTEKEELLYGFPHRTFEEYFAAVCLANLPDEKLLPTLRRHLHDPRWEEVILLTLGHLYFANNEEKREYARQLLWQLCLDPNRQPSEYEDLFHRDLLFALRACGDGIYPPDLERLADEVLGIYFDTDKDKGKGRYELLRQQMEAQFKANAGNEFSKAAAPKVLRLLNNDDARVRRRIADMLGQLKVQDDAVISGLFSLLTDKREYLRAMAAAALGNIGITDERVINKLLDMLNDVEAIVKIYAEDALAELGVVNEQVVDKLTEVMADMNQEVWIYAEEALKKLGSKNDRTISLLLRCMANTGKKDVWGNIMAVLQRLELKSKQAVDELLTMMADEDRNIRLNALELLRGHSLSGGRVINKAFDLLDDPDKYVPYRAAEVLGRQGMNDERIITTLVGYLGDATKKVSLASAEVLSQLGVKNEQVIGTLLGLLDDPDRNIRHRAAELLGQLQVSDEPVVTKLWSLLGDQDKYMRLRAVDALVQLDMRNEQMVETLLAFLLDEDRSVSKQAVDLIRKVGVKDELAINTMIGFLANKDKNAQLRAVEVLSQFGSKNEQAVSTIMNLLADKDSNVRVRTVVLLGQVGLRDDQVVSKLLDLLADAAGDVRGNVAEAMIELGVIDDRAERKLMELMRNENQDLAMYAVQTMTKFGFNNELVTDKLIELIKNGNIDVQLRFVKLLGQARINRKEVQDTLYQIAISPEVARYVAEPYSTAYEALYAIVSSERSVADPDICKD